MLNVLDVGRSRVCASLLDDVGCWIITGLGLGCFLKLKCKHHTAYSIPGTVQLDKYSTALVHVIKC